MVSRAGYVGMFGVAPLVTVRIGGCTAETPVATPTVVQGPQEAIVMSQPTQVPVTTPGWPATTYYIVQMGDTPRVVGGRFEVSVETLLEFNERLGASRLQPSQGLVILPADDEGSDGHLTLERSQHDSANLKSLRLEPVTAGETSWSIALRDGTTLDETAEPIEVESDQLPMIGQRLSVPRPGEEVTSVGVRRVAL